jgi:hypothetical protein
MTYILNRITTSKNLICAEERLRSLSFICHLIISVSMTAVSQSFFTTEKMIIQIQFISKLRQLKAASKLNKQTFRICVTELPAEDFTFVSTSLYSELVTSKVTNFTFSSRAIGVQLAGSSTPGKVVLLIWSDICNS